MKKVIVILLVFLSITARAQVTYLSKDAEISLITCGPWQGELYSAFGHSAIRVYDPAYNLDIVYNYGVFDFNQPNFYLNYTKGLLNFELGAYSYPDFRDFYISYNRSVTEQVLNLDRHQKQDLFSYLEWNALPENKVYRYDYFYNNCATKIRDILVFRLTKSIEFDDSFIKSHYTIRQLTDLFLQKQPWGDLGIDICLGLPMDKPATPYQYMFLPDYLLDHFDHAKVISNGIKVPLVKEKKLVYIATEEPTAFNWFSPWTVFGLVLIISIILTIIDLRRKRLSKWFDIILFGITGLIGILLLLLWVATDHRAAAKNFNLLWALPTHILILGLFFKSNFVQVIKKYFQLTFILLLLTLVGWFLLPQQMNNYLLPFVAAMTCRAFALSRLL